MTKMFKRLIFASFCLLLISPFIVDLIVFYNNHTIFLLESSIFGFDYGNFFSQFFSDKSVFTSGNSAISALSSSFFFAILYFLEFFLTPLSAFFFFLISAVSLSYYFFVRLFNELIELTKASGNRQFYYIASCILGLIFFTSISNFLFLSSTITFFLCTLILIIQLFIIKRYVIDNEKKWLIYFLVLNFFAIFNITNFLINTIFTNIFAYILLYIKYAKLFTKDYVKKLFFINIFYLPFLIIFFVQIVVGYMYVGSFNEVVVSIREDFYSLGTSFINSFNHTNFWGLFGGFNGNLYFNFSGFYKNNYINIFSFLPYILVAFLLIKTAKKQINRELNKLILFFILLFLLLFQITLGLRNPIYKFLYEEITIFQIFRDITKFSPILLLTILLVLFLLILKREYKSLSGKIIIIFILFSALIYNIPYWTYSQYFFKSRTIETIPGSYYDTANYLNKKLSINDNILLLPAIYNLDYYYWNNKKINVQGNLFDVLLNQGIKSFRLTQGFTGSIFFQKDSSKLFVKSSKSVRELDIDYSLLSDFVKKYGLDYIVITKDLVSEYQDMIFLQKWLGNNGYLKVNSFGNNDIYFNSSIYKSIFSFADPLNYKRINAKNYQISITNIKKNSQESLVFFDSFNKYWNLYLMPVSENSANEIQYLWKKPVFADSHQIFDQYANKWVIDSEYIKQNFSKKYYRENSDGSINIVLSLYFIPQLYFFLGLASSFFILIACVVYVYYSKNKIKAKYLKFLDKFK